MKLKTMSAKTKIIIFFVAVIVVTGIIILITRNGSKADAYVEIVVARGNIEPTVLSTGTVQPENRLEIKPPIAGRINRVFIEEGAVVKKGQMLVEMSSTERAALLDAARAQGDSELKRWETYYRPAPILAPLDGTIIVRSVEPGQTVTSSDVLLVMSDRLTVKARVDETDIGSIKLAQKAEIVLDAYPDDRIPGVVDKIAYDSKTVNNVTTYIADVLPNSTPDAMRSGMTANVSFFLDAKNDVLCLPTNAVRISGGKSYVLVKPKLGTADPVRQEVKTGISDGNKIEITEGLKESENVLIEKIKMLGSDSKKTNPFLPAPLKQKKNGNK